MLLVQCVLINDISFEIERKYGNSIYTKYTKEKFECVEVMINTIDIKFLIFNGKKIAYKQIAK